ncbi:hypothetical protein N7468_009593 [Penicillium chermesinum]|uniref:DNA recombination and repair protein Rad51-like C-terminal domain-containing protein n=1 Tax=Penicillium chermesinum TaxID=63820 RepID=A0A9W9NKK5_9EURO|nr:uncharacterized protein N7468_009593 [Penicillium chermesinum]KAJ5220389.1 hypothetical protein N7468_009593 [Penicillium chermesinum]KAJ6157828.1 hypothetical protein N7470_005420 [Penicillium chermesinum]
MREQILHDLANVYPVSPEQEARSLNVPAIDVLLEVFMLKAMGPGAEHRQPHPPSPEQRAAQEQNRLAEEMLFRGEEETAPATEPISPSNVFFSDSAYRSKRPCPVVEISSNLSGAGKTELLYYLVALSILPRAIGEIPVDGQNAAVVFIDADDRFDAERLRTIARAIVRKSYGSMDREGSGEESDVSADDIEAILLSALKHVHVFRPESSSALLATLESLDEYLYDISRHYSASRPLQMIAIDSATAFIWLDRLRDEIARTEDIGRPQAEIERERELKLSFFVSDLYAELVKQLKRLQSRFGSAVVFTSTVPEARPAKNSTEYTGPPGPFDQPSSRTPALRPALPAPWGTFPILRLVVQRDTVWPFPPTMSAHDARSEASMRQSVVLQGKFSAWVNAWGREEWPRRVVDGISYTGGSFPFYVKASGVEIPLPE